MHLIVLDDHHKFNIVEKNTFLWGKYFDFHRITFSFFILFETQDWCYPVFALKYNFFLQKHQSFRVNKCEREFLERVAVHRNTVSI